MCDGEKTIARILTGIFPKAIELRIERPETTKAAYNSIKADTSLDLFTMLWRQNVCAETYRVISTMGGWVKNVQFHCQFIGNVISVEFE